MKKLLLNVMIVCAVISLFVLSASNTMAQSPKLESEDDMFSDTSMKYGGFMESHWSQDYPYNQLCPKDPFNNNSYSYAGCPAVAMGQIINYLRTTQGTRFSDSDDYVHQYAGRNYNIDDDYKALGFLPFFQLNKMLDSIDAVLMRGEQLSDLQSAALVFACGTACKQVYTSEGSGTFYVDQAFDAYKRFGFDDCVLFREPDSAMYATLISNLQDGFPAHLAVENPEGTIGHNLVVDGYRKEDGKFHMNFGYGGAWDGWYDIPDPDFYYGMTKMEGIILNIIPSTAALNELSELHSLEIYPNPVSDALVVKEISLEVFEYSIFNVIGQEVSNGFSSGTISVMELESGVYLLQIKEEDVIKTTKFVVKR